MPEKSQEKMQEKADKSRQKQTKTSSRKTTMNPLIRSMQSDEVSDYAGAPVPNTGKTT